MPAYGPGIETLGAATGAGLGSGFLSTLGQVLAPLDYPRQALWNLVRSTGRALSGEGNWEDALRAIPGVAGAGLAGGLVLSGVGAPLGILAGSALGGAVQGGLRATDEERYEAPRV